MNTRRDVPGALKATLGQQVNRKIKELQDEGKITDDFAETKNGFQSWVELMTVIDDESPDPVRLDALKAMFFAVNKVNQCDAERSLAYRLFQIAKKLTSGQLSYLHLCYRMYKARDLTIITGQRDVERKEAVSKLAHAILAQLCRNNPALVDLGLLATRLLPEPFDQYHGEMTALGVKFCEEIQKYHLEARDEPEVMHRCWPTSFRET